MSPRFTVWLPFYLSNLFWVHIQVFLGIFQPAFSTDLTSGITLRGPACFNLCRSREFWLKKFFLFVVHKTSYHKHFFFRDYFRGSFWNTVHAEIIHRFHHGERWRKIRTRARLTDSQLPPSLPIRHQQSKDPRTISEMFSQIETTLKRPCACRECWDMKT